MFALLCQALHSLFFHLFSVLLQFLSTFSQNSQPGAFLAPLVFLCLLLLLFTLLRGIGHDLFNQRYLVDFIIVLFDKDLLDGFASWLLICYSGFAAAGNLGQRGVVRDVEGWFVSLCGVAFLELFDKICYVLEVGELFPGGVTLVVSLPLHLVVDLAVYHPLADDAFNDIEVVRDCAGLHKYLYIIGKPKKKLI